MFKVRQIIIDLVVKAGVSIFNKILFTGLLKNVIIRIGQGDIDLKTISYIVSFIVYPFKHYEEEIENLIDLLKSYNLECQILWSVYQNDSASDGFDPNHLKCIYNEDVFVYSKLDKMKFKIQPMTFFQVNDEGCIKLQDIIRNYILNFKNENNSKPICLLDLCSGVGTIGI